MNMFERPAFVRKVRSLGETLGYPEIFERWLKQAAAGQYAAMANLKDYGLIPYTKEEMKDFIDEYASYMTPKYSISTGLVRSSTARYPGFANRRRSRSRYSV